MAMFDNFINIFQNTPQVVITCPEDVSTGRQSQASNNSLSVFPLKFDPNPILQHSAAPEDNHQDSNREIKSNEIKKRLIEYSSRNIDQSPLLADKTLTLETERQGSNYSKTNLSVEKM